jgi:hypothetical protein
MRLLPSRGRASIGWKLPLPSPGDVVIEIDKSQSEPLRLDFREERRLVVQTQDDRYFTTSERMAEACRQSADVETWTNELHDFLADLHQWMRDHSEVVVGCYLAPGEGAMVAYVTTFGEEYRFDFDDDVVDLELRLHEVFPRHPVEVMHMPTASPDALRSFFSPDSAFQVYGQSDATRRQG